MLSPQFITITSHCFQRLDRLKMKTPSNKPPCSIIFQFVVFLLFLNAVRAEDKMKLADPPKPSEAAAMARYIMHKSGKMHV